MNKYGGGDGYDQAMYDQLWNGVNFILRDLLSRGRVRIPFPRPQIVLNLHTHPTAQDLQSK
jgi:hypothetical protein